MKRMILATALLISLSGCFVMEELTDGDSGTTLPDGTLDPNDPANWDISVCFEDFDNFDVCYDLFWDNREMLQLNQGLN